MQTLETLRFYLAFPFVQRAVLVGMAVALCASLLGPVLVLRRFSSIGSGLSGVAFGAMALAAVLRLDSRMALALPLTALAAVLMLRRGARSRIRGDALLAMLSVSALAAGYLLLNLAPPGGNVSADVCTALFGSTSILTLSPQDVWLSLLLCALVLLSFALLYPRLFALTFDEDFARAGGLNAGALNLLLAVIVAAVVVLSMHLVGSLLITALIVLPALSAMQLCRSFRAVTLCSVAFSAVCTLAGLLAAVLAGTPVGAVIVVTHLTGFLLTAAIGAVKKHT